MPEGRKLGFIAQDIGKIVPELMNTIKVPKVQRNNKDSILYGEDFLYGVHEKDIIALLLESIKELKIRVEELEKKSN